jgi:hypothetical protein
MERESSKRTDQVREEDRHVNDPFADYQEDEQSTEDVFAKLRTMILALKAAETAVVMAETDLRKVQETLRQVQEHDLPEYMASLGLETFTTTDGLAVRVDEKIHASIGDRKVVAYKWLIDNGHGGLIKRTVEVAFNVDQAEQAEALVCELVGQYAGVRQNMKVEAATLTAFVKEQLEKGEDIPHDIFGVFEQRIARIEQKE